MRIGVWKASVGPRSPHWIPAIPTDGALFEMHEKRKVASIRLKQLTQLPPSWLATHPYRARNFNKSDLLTALLDLQVLSDFVDAPHCQSVICLIARLFPLDDHPQHVFFPLTAQILSHSPTPQ